MLWVQSPTGMPATHGSCIGSGGRDRTCVGLRSERSWDTSNPHLNNLAGRLGVAPSFPALETGTSLRGSPQIGGEQTTRRPCPRGHPAVSSRVQHPDCFTLLIGGRQCSRNTCPEGHPLFSRQVQQPRLVYRPNLADAVRVERTHPEGPLPGSNRLSTPHARIRNGGRQCARCTHPCGVRLA